MTSAIDLDFTEVSTEGIGIPVDEAPETTDEVRTCQEPGCANEVFRRGTRGRWPTRCDEHKRSGSTRGTSARTRATSGDAEKAASILAGYNDMIGTMLAAASFVPGLPSFVGTATAIADRNDAFREAAAKALTSDPKTVKMILRAGQTTGKAGLIMAYAMLGVGIAPAVKADIEAAREGGE